MLVDRGLVMVVKGYHKGFSRTEKLKVIQRFLPPEVGTLLVYYLWLVLPFWEETLSNIDATRRALAQCLGPGGNPWRRGPDGIEGHAELAAGDPQPPKRRWIARSGAGPHWTPARLSRVLRRLSRPACADGVTVSSWRHISIAIGRRFQRGSTAGFGGAEGPETLLGDESDDEGPDADEDSPRDLQAGHGSLIAGRVYGRLVMDGDFETTERRGGLPKHQPPVARPTWLGLRSRPGWRHLRDRP